MVPSPRLTTRGLEAPVYVAGRVLGELKLKARCLDRSRHDWKMLHTPVTTDP